jgi:hypothetical protein
VAQIFPEWTNRIPIYLVFGLVFAVIGSVAFVWYYFSPWYTDVGYRPKQPVEYSHKLHAGDLGLDCRYCHSNVEFSAVANIPPTQTCMNCHEIIKPESEKLAPVRESWETGVPIEWIRVHKIPDFAYFSHQAHLRAGVGCYSCHGDVSRMEVVTQRKPLSMSWCLDCHRNPLPHLRPQSELTNMNWKRLSDDAQPARAEAEMTMKPPTDCSRCHR